MSCPPHYFKPHHYDSQERPQTQPRTRQIRPKTSKSTMNTSTTDPYTGEAINPALSVTLLTIGWVACVSGVLGNVLIIATLLSQPALRSLHNLYIGNLAVADLIISSYSVPFWLLDLGGGRHPVANSAHCVCNAFITCCAFGTSVLTLVVISFNRYLSVCHHALFVRVSVDSVVNVCSILLVFRCGMESSSWFK
ncbi:melatonin receptor type 1A-like [Littorina saxatilis]|uniref:melatonin receptor type 1A-like n=1 Tax=Littorina saxatilis TaxID=31220 RepID=UPI0038B442FD